MGLIYLLQINNKSYIGQTKQTFEKRLKGHRKTSKNPKDKSYDLPLYRAIRKYGWEDLTSEIIEDGIDDCDLNDREIYYIAEYNSMTPNGYNMTSGGNQAMICSDETREKMRIAANKRYENLELHDKISEAAIKRFQNPEERKKASVRSKNRDICNPRKCTDTMDLPKYVSIRRRPNGVRYMIIDHPKCKYKYFGVKTRSSDASEISLTECLAYLESLNEDLSLVDSEVSDDNETKIDINDVVIKRKMFQKISHECSSETKW